MIVSVLGLVCAATATSAVRVSYTDDPAAGLGISAPAGERNDVTVTLECEGQRCQFRVVEALEVVASAGQGCALTSVQPATIVCEIDRGVRTVRASLGDEDDRLRMDRCDAPVVVVADLGAGNDRFSGCAAATPSDDDVTGGPGQDLLQGAGGGDRLDGGFGADRIETRDADPDTVTCGTDPGVSLSRGEVVVLATAPSLDLAVVDPRDGLPRDCERIQSARVGERTGVAVSAIGVAQPRRGLIRVRLACRLPRCEGRARADLTRRRTPVARIPSSRATTFNLQRGVTLRAPVSLPRADLIRIVRAGRRVVAARIVVFEPGRRGGWRTTVVTIPVRR